MSKKLNLIVPITKVDEEKRLVYGVATCETPDKSGEIFDYASSAPLARAWSAEIEKMSQGKSLGNIRYMHQLDVVGKAVDINFNDAEKSIEVCSKVTDDNAWKKVQDGLLVAYSIGGDYKKQWLDPTNKQFIRYTAALSEISLVDNPCNPDAGFQYVKADGTQELRKFVPPPVNSDDKFQTHDAGGAVEPQNTVAPEAAAPPEDDEDSILDELLMEQDAADEVLAVPAATPSENAKAAAAALQKILATGASIEGADLAKALKDLTVAVEKLTAQEDNMTKEELKKARKSIHEKLAMCKANCDSFHKAHMDHLDGLAKMIGGPESTGDDKGFEVEAGLGGTPSPAFDGKTITPEMQKLIDAAVEAGIKKGVTQAITELATEIKKSDNTGIGDRSKAVKLTPVEKGNDGAEGGEAVLTAKDINWEKVSQNDRTEMAKASKLQKTVPASKWIAANHGA